MHPPTRSSGLDRDLADPPAGLILSSVADRIDAVLEDFLRRRAEELATLDAALAPVARSVTALVTTGGKRLRPAFVWWGYRAAMLAGHAPGTDTTATDAPGTDPEVLRPAAAVELLHTFALIHDDIMDRSPTRRGIPAVHAALADHHRAADLQGDPDWFGVGGGILAGDMVFVWADMLFEEGVLEPAGKDRARQVFAHLRCEVMAGQYLDLRLAGLRQATDADSLRVSLLKSGRYTVTRPLQMGAAFGAPDPVLDAALTTFGDAIGVAFQLRDDVLGLVGDPDTTGKGALEDVREGKRTLLVLRAQALADEGQRKRLDDVLGDPRATIEDVDDVRQIVTETGALADVERRVATLRRTAEQAIGDVRPPARAALMELAADAIDRDA